jgi:hypothetical protein
VRLALLGPADGDVAALARAAHAAVFELGADRIVYLGVDDALDAVVAGWSSLLGAEVSLAAKAGVLLRSSATTIEQALDAEAARRSLARLFLTLPAPGARCIEILQERIVLLVDDKGGLDEEDLLPATFIVFGRGEPTIRKVGSRVFLCPGAVAASGQGLLLLDEGASTTGVVASLHDRDGHLRSQEFLDTTRSARLRVHGVTG